MDRLSYALLYIARVYLSPRLLQSERPVSSWGVSSLSQRRQPMFQPARDEERISVSGPLMDQLVIVACMLLLQLVRPAWH